MVAERVTAPRSGSPLVFDRVLVKDGAAWRELTTTEFFALPLSIRIRHVIERTVAFQLGGKEVDRKQALAALRQLSVGG